MSAPVDTPAAAGHAFPMPDLSAADVAAVLTGLRLLQTFSDHPDRLPSLLLAILEDGGVDGVPSVDAIDTLCDRINRT